MDEIYKTPDSELTNAANSASDYSLYKMSAIGIATFFGSALAGGYIARRNLINLNEHAKGNNILYISAAITFSILLIAVLVPEDVNIPGAVFTVVQLVAMLQLSKAWFGEDVERHRQNGGKFYSNWRAFGISLLVLVGVLAVVIPLAFLYFSFE